MNNVHLRINRMKTRMAELVELFRTPMTAIEAATILGVSSWTIIAYTIKLRDMENPWLSMKRNKDGYGVFTTIRDDEYIPDLIAPPKAVEYSAPETDYLQRLMGYTALKPKTGTKYHMDDFDALKRKHNGIWNPVDKPNRHYGVSGSTLSMVV